VIIIVSNDDILTHVSIICVFKIDLVCYMDMLLFSMYGLSIVHVVIALEINLILKVSNCLTIQKLIGALRWVINLLM
jgi:hypothetical protein